jgi:hypothetical protein
MEGSARDGSLTLSTSSSLADWASHLSGRAFEHTDHGFSKALTDRVCVPERNLHVARTAVWRRAVIMAPRWLLRFCLRGLLASVLNSKENFCDSESARFQRLSTSIGRFFEISGKRGLVSLIEKRTVSVFANVEKARWPVH